MVENAVSSVAGVGPVTGTSSGIRRGPEPDVGRGTHDAEHCNAGVGPASHSEIRCYFEAIVDFRCGP